MKMAESSQNGQKTLWEKEKSLITSNFSFSHSVLKRLVLQTRKNQGLFGKARIKSAFNLDDTNMTSYSLILDIFLENSLSNDELVG